MNNLTMKDVIKGIVYTPTVSHAEKVELIMEIMEVVYEDGYTQGKEDLRDLILEIIYMIYYDYEYSIDGDRQLLNEHIVECLKENREWEE